MNEKKLGPIDIFFIGVIVDIIVVGITAWAILTFTKQYPIAVAASAAIGLTIGMVTGSINKSRKSE